MTNPELLDTAYAEIHRAGTLVRQLKSATDDGPIPSEVARRHFCALKQHLSRALCAAQELENRAIGLAPAKVG